MAKYFPLMKKEMDLISHEGHEITFQKSPCWQERKKVKNKKIKVARLRQTDVNPNWLFDGKIICFGDYLGYYF